MNTEQLVCYSNSNVRKIVFRAKIIIRKRNLVINNSQKDRTSLKLTYAPDKIASKYIKHRSTES